MSRRTRRVGALVALFAVLTLLPACGKPDENRVKVQKAIRATQPLAFRFVYEDKRPELPAFLQPRPRPGQPATAIPRESVVQGVLEDNFRYKARVVLDGAPAYEKVVDDDTLAIRFLDPDRIAPMVDRAALDRVDTKTDIPGISVIEALKSQRWVLDPAAAPSLIGIGSTERGLGADPVNDALGVFDYVLNAIDNAQSVDKWNKDALDPTYRPTEDPFPKPSGGSGVTRYDLRRPRLPGVGQVGSSGRADLPAIKHFRKMAIYVKDNRVVQVIERIELTGRSLEEFLDYNKAFLREQGMTEKDIDAQLEQLEGAPQEELGKFLLAGLSLGLSQGGGEPIVQRAMVLDLQDLGAPNKVEVPTEDVVKGNLTILIGAGNKPQEVSGSSATTSTTVASGDGGGVGPTDTSTP